MTSSGGDGGVLDGQGLLAALTGGAGWLQTNKAAVDALNVYPVPDGDTGTNMLLTIQTALRAGAGESGRRHCWGDGGCHRTGGAAGGARE